MMKRRKGPRCKRCGSTQLYVRLRSQDIVCRRCGHIEKIRRKRRRKAHTKKVVAVERKEAGDE